MDSGEWTLAFNYLLERLAEREADSSLITEIRLASTLRIEDTTPLLPEIIERRKKMRSSNGDFESRTFRALTPDEVFFSSIQILITRLREVPALSERLQELLNRRPDKIHWSPDASETEFKAPQENFTAEAITISPEEQVEINSFLNLIESLYRDEQAR